MKYTLTLASLFFLSGLFAQNKALTIDDLSAWNRISNRQVSHNGDYVLYRLVKEIGDPELKIYDTNTEGTFSFPRAHDVRFDYSGEFAFWILKASQEHTDSLKLAKVKKEEMPADTLCIYELDTKVLKKIPNISNYKQPRESSGYIAYQQTTGIAKDTINEEQNKDNGYHLKLLNLSNYKTDSLQYVKDFYFSVDSVIGLVATVATTSNNNTPGVYLYNFDDSKFFQILDQKGDYHEFTFTKDASKIAFLADTDTVATENIPYDIYQFRDGKAKAEKLVAYDDKRLASGHFISGNSKLAYYDDDEQLFFGAREKEAEKDTTILDEDRVNVEIWNTADDRLYTQQENSLANDKKRTYQYAHDADNNKITQITQTLDESPYYAEESDEDEILLIDRAPYQKMVSWVGRSHFDAYTIDVESGKRKKVITNEPGRPWLSPSGKHLAWYNPIERSYKMLDVPKKQVRTLADKYTGAFYDELNDRPMDPGSYGWEGWTEDEEHFVVYDRYDIWLLSPKKNDTPQKITNGRKDKVVSRLVPVKDRDEYLSLRSPILFHQFNENSKEEAYGYITLPSGKTKMKLNVDQRLTSRPMVSEDRSTLVFTKEDFVAFPDLHITKDSFDTYSKVSNANPQQEDFRWGTVQLHDWKSLDGTELQGLLVLPDDFDPKKKYPMIVNFYERNSDGLHRHRAPYPHRSTINYSFYVSKGYVIFNPDIVYKVGYPGESSYNSVVSGVNSLIEKGFIDKDRIGLQGHSWGGYQIAHILTKTNMFKCAEAGAPVVNMTSAYGGIRWGSGMSRMFQYEKTQSRIGKTLWNGLDLYLENSPLFSLENMTTPVLILHNDADGAVPWYQGIEYFVALRRLDKTAWLLNYNDEPHWPLKLYNRIDFNRRLEQFFDYYLMDQPLPVWMKEGVPAVKKGIDDGLQYVDDRQ